MRDRSATRGVRLSGAGVSRSTGVKFVGTATWKVTLTKGTLVYASDRGASRCSGGGRVPGLADGPRRYSVLPPTSQTGPWVSTLSVSESTRRTRVVPAMPSSSSRSKQRRAIELDTP